MAARAMASSALPIVLSVAALPIPVLRQTPKTQQGFRSCWLPTYPLGLHFFAIGRRIATTQRSDGYCTFPSTAGGVTMSIHERKNNDASSRPEEAETRVSVEKEQRLPGRSELEPGPVAFALSFYHLRVRMPRLPMVCHKVRLIGKPLHIRLFWRACRLCRSLAYGMLARYRRC
jgi:hypothetical protein